MPSDYDDEIWRSLPREPGPPRRELIEFVRRLAPAQAALDLGCGDGRLTAELLAGELTAADVSPVALDRARERLPQARFVEIRPDAGLPFADSSFDLVVCVETIEHVRDIQRFLSEIRRVLRPGGRLALTTPGYGRVTGFRVIAKGFERIFDPLSPHLRFFTRRSSKALLEGMGFELMSVARRKGTLLVTAIR